ncbi:MAG: hypothetical protein RIF32_19010 [Leptospirales bacterium]|jgi:chaperonin GroES
MSTASSLPQTLTPLAGQVLLTREDPEDKIGSFHAPENCRTQQARGRVVVAGAGTVVAAGDRVIFSRYAVQELRFEGVDYLCVKEEDILAVVTDED